MTFQQLQYLLEVERTGSFSLAAKAMFVTQSTISNALTALEKELNCRIFVRSTRGLTLTTEGKQVVAYAQRICENHRLLTDATLPAKAQLRVNAPAYPPARDAFLRFMDENAGGKDLKLSFNENKNVDMFDKLLYGYADVTIGVSFTPYDQDYIEIAKKKKLQRMKLATIPAVIKIGPGHRLYDQPHLQPQDFAGDRLLDGAGAPVANSKVLLAYVPINKENVLVCNDPTLRREMLRRGYGYCITRLPDRSEREGDDFRYIPIPGLSYSAGAFFDAIRPLSPEASRYLELLQEEIAAAEARENVTAQQPEAAVES